MQLNMSKRSILVILVLVALAAATVVVAGYVDKSGQTAQVAAQDKCGACSRQDTEGCCQAKAAESGATHACPASDAAGTCAAKPAGCGGANAEAPGCAMSASPSPAPSSCGVMRCPHAEPAAPGE